MAFDVNAFNVAKYDRILAKGLSQGLGKRRGTMCIEAAICTVLGLPHGDDPKCVAHSVRRFKIRLNDSYRWSSPQARAKGLHDLGLAQLGSLGVVNDREFATKLAEKVIRVLLPTLFRDVFKDKPDCLAAAQRCEDEGTIEAALNAQRVANTHYKEAAAAAAWAAARAEAAADKYLILAANLALDVLKELESPGCTLLAKEATHAE